MATQKLVEKLNKEVKDLRKDVSQMKSVLLRVLAIPEERLEEYANTEAIKKSFEKALKVHPRASR
mgnify:FL=1